MANCWTDIRLIGRGAQGAVHLVRSQDGTWRVAKRVDLASLGEREQQAAHRECGLLRHLSHPHIVEYVESYTEGTVLVMVMEWCRGGDLAEHVERTRSDEGRLCDRRVLRWFGQMADALEYMHARCVLHRDLKSSNAFLTETLDVKLGDLGISKILESAAAQAESVVGTPQYLSPELCKNERYSFSADMWSLGCVVYELCALKRPFDAPTWMGVFHCVIKADIDLAPIQDRNADLVSLVSKLLVKEASRRPDAASVRDDARAARARLDQHYVDEGGKSFASVCVITSPPASPATSGFLLESFRALNTASPSPARAKPDKRPPFMRSARRAADAARRRKPSLSSDDEASSRRTSRSSFGSDHNPAAPPNRPQHVGSGARHKPRRRATLDDIPEQQHQPRPVAPTSADAQRRRLRSLGDLPGTSSTASWPPSAAAAVGIVPRCSSGSSSRGEPRPSYDDDTDDQAEDQPALTSPAAAKLRAKLGDRVFFAVCGMFRDAYDRGASVSRHDLLGVVGTQEKYLDCFKVERLVYADYVAGHYYCEAG